MTDYAIRPPALLPGARVGVAALSGPVSSSEREEGMAALRALELDPVAATNLTLTEGLFAGSDRERVEGLHRLAADPDLDALWFARGGHGVLRLLPEIDWSLLGSRPRWFIGYSDVTPLLMQVVRRFGWVAVHGPMVAVDAARGLDEGETDSLLTVVREGGEARVPLAGVEGDWRGVEGPLVGGCLSLLASVLGTAWSVGARGGVLFLEDVNEPLYRVDRMLQQLRLGGALDGVRGVVLGQVSDLSDGDDGLADLLAAVAAAVGSEVPVAWGCPSGHCRPNHSLALGARAAVDAISGELVVGEG